MRSRHCAETREDGDNCPFCKLDLERVERKRRGRRKFGLRGSRECGLVCGLTNQRGFRRNGAPRFVRNAAESQSRLCDDAVLELESRCNRDECEGVARSIADFAVSRIARATSAGGSSSAVISSRGPSCVSTSG